MTDQRSPRKMPAQPTRAQIRAAQLLVKREAKGLGTVSEDVRRLARMAPAN